MIVKRIAKADVRGLWPAVLPFIERALDRGLGEYLPEDIFAAIRDGSMQLLVAVDDDANIVAAFVTEIITFPRKTLFRVTLGAGEGVDEWGPEIERMMEIGAANIGAELIGLDGRPGWRRWIKRLGNYNETVVLRRMI